uniref:Uncharacterized protein n=1 Tax=Rhizophora mucronata TaxID=61149 RepID=A0A2P2P7B4_RHIMU
MAQKEETGDTLNVTCHSVKTVTSQSKIKPMLFAVTQSTSIGGK